MIILCLNPHTLPTKFACVRQKTKICVNVMKDFILAIISLRYNTVTMANSQTCLWPVYKAWRITLCVLSQSPANCILLSKLQL